MSAKSSARVRCIGVVGDGAESGVCDKCIGIGVQKGSNDHEWETYMEPCEACCGTGRAQTDASRSPTKALVDSHANYEQAPLD